MDNINKLKRLKRIIILSLILAVFVFAILLILDKPEKDNNYVFKNKEPIKEENTVKEGSVENEAFYKDADTVTVDSAFYSDALTVTDITSLKILYNKNEDTEFDPGTLTHIMTMLVVIEKSNDLGIAIDDMTVIDHLYRMILEGSAQSANLLAAHVAQNTDDFTKLMNTKAAAIGMENTVFCNADGSENAKQLTTAYDMTLLFNAAVNEPLAAQIMSTKEYSGSLNQDVLIKSDLFSHMTGEEPYGSVATMGKLGYTDDGQNHLMLYAISDSGKRYIGIFMGAGTSYNHIKDAVSLLDKLDTIR